MLKSVFSILLLFMSVCSAFAQTQFSLYDVDPGARDGIFISISDKQILSAYFHTLNQNMENFDLIAVPLSAENFTVTSNEIVLHQKLEKTLLINYRISSNLRQERISQFDLKPVRIDFSDDNSFSDSVSSRGFTIKQSGIRRHVTLYFGNSESSEVLAHGSRLPDIIAIGLPLNYRGLSLHDSESMVKPEPLLGPNPMVFSSSSLPDNRIELSFTIAEPKSFKRVTEVFFKTIPLMLAFLAMLILKGEQLRKTRAQIVFSVLTFVIFSLFVYFGWKSYSLELGLSLVIENALLAALTLLFPLFFRWLKNDGEPSK